MRVSCRIDIGRVDSYIEHDTVSMGSSLVSFEAMIGSTDIDEGERLE